MLNFAIYNEEEITQELDARIRENLCVSFPHNAWYFKDARGWKGTFPTWSVIGLDSDDNPVVHCGVVERTVTIENKPYKAFGVQNVYVLEAYRGKGLARKMITLVEEEALQRNIGFGLLFARPHVAGLYTSLGWTQVEAKVVLLDTVNKQEFTREFVHDALYYKAVHSEPLPSGTIHFNGLDW